MTIPAHRLPLLLAALGDALGAGVEGGHALARAQEEDREAIGRRFFPHSPFGFAPGEVTDDTQMAWALLEALHADPPPLDSPAGRERYARLAFAAYRRWCRSRPPDVGGQTASALAHADHHGGFLVWAGGTSAGNGSLMRATGPIALGYRGPDLLAAAVLDAVLTHADPTCAAAGAWYAATLDAALAEEAPARFPALARAALSLLDPLDPAALLHGLAPGDHLATFLARWPAAIEQVAETVDAALDGAHVDCDTEPHPVWPTGWVISSLGQAVWAASAGADAGHCLRLAVRHGGRDADTIAAIAGGLIGARFGTAALDQVDGELLAALRFGHHWEATPRAAFVDALAGCGP